MPSNKAKVLAKHPGAFCIKLDRPVAGSNYIVWPAKCQPRGFEQPAIGLGITAGSAWWSAWNNINL